jgi:hypothetical protein
VRAGDLASNADLVRHVTRRLYFDHASSDIDPGRLHVTNRAQAPAKEVRFLVGQAVDKVVVRFPTEHGHILPGSMTALNRSEARAYSALFYVCE